MDKILAMLLIPVGLWLLIGAIGYKPKRPKQPEPGRLSGESEDDYWNRQY